MWGVLLNGQAALQRPLGDVFSHAHHQQTAACAGCSQLGQGSSPGALGRRAGPVGRKPPAGARRTFPGQPLAGGRVTWPSRLQQAGLPGRLVRCPGSSACWVLLELAGAKLHWVSHMPAGCQGSEKVGEHGGTVKGKHLLSPGALRRPLSQAQHRASWPGRAVPGPQVGSRRDLGRQIFLSAYSIHFG